jgi:hypothetical protein
METDETKLYGRLFKAKIVTVIGLLLGMWISRPLWTSWSRTIPRVPFLGDLSPASMPWIEFVLSSMILVAILGVLLASHQVNRFITAILLLLVSLALLDQTRIQPWIYEYWLLLLVFVLCSRDTPDQGKDHRTIALAQLLVAALYFWSGAQKLNYTFLHETLPNLLGPVQNVLGFRLPLTGIALGVAFAEIFTGVALHFRRTRNLAVGIAVAMHAGVLALLIARGYNQVVWAWNFILILLNVILFWNCEVFAVATFRSWRNVELRSRLAHLVVFASILLPALSFVGWWDMYLSGALYSGNTEIAVINVDPPLQEKLPAMAKGSVFTTGAGETVLPLQEWSLRELNVPPYPQLRVYRQIANQICPFSSDPQQTGLIVRGRPNAWNGSYEVIRIPCITLMR